MSFKYTYLNHKFHLNLGGELVNLTKQVWGILNITPDSFFDGGKYNTLDSILSQTEKMIFEGADVIDIGAASSRPGADLISEEEEWNRLFPVLKVLVKRFPQTPFSIDTYWSSVARRAIEEGASIINDITGGTADQSIFEVVARYQTPYVLMHLRGGPNGMHQKQDYKNITQEVINELSHQIQKAREYGVNDIIIDPGFGFSKNLSQNFELLANIHYFSVFQLPLLVGISRKSLIYKTLQINSSEALNGSSVLNTFAVLKGARILRVHDVKEAKELIVLLNHLNLF